MSMMLLRRTIRETLLESELELSSVQKRALSAVDELPEMANDDFVFAEAVFGAMIPHLEDVFDEITIRRWSEAAKHLTLERISLRGLTAVQRGLNKELLRRYIIRGTAGPPLGRSSPGAQPFVVEVDGRRLAIDGQHRLATEILMGNTTGMAKVFRENEATLP